MPGENNSVPDLGQVAAQIEDPQSGQSQGSFFEVKTPEGKLESYKTKDELEKAYRESFLRQSDYTKKTMTLAEERKKHEQTLKEFQEQQKSFLKNKEQYDKWDEILKSRPEVYRQLSNIASRPASHNEIIEATRNQINPEIESLKKEIEAIKAEKQAREQEEQLNKIYSDMKAKYEDFDSEAIASELSSLSNGDVSSLIEKLHFARRGQLTPQQIQEKFMANQEKKKKAGLMPAGGGSPHNSNAPKNIEEARERAMAEWNGAE